MRRRRKTTAFLSSETLFSKRYGIFAVRGTPDMFGYLTADRSSLEEKDFAEYRSVYCGICSELRKNGLLSGTLSLSYDLVFLWMILTSMYEPQTERHTGSCPLHPFSGREMSDNIFTGYVSDIGTILAYYKAIDDWRDDRDPVKLTASRILSRPFRNASARLPRQASVIKESLDRISMMEESQSGDIDGLCNLFGTLLGETFVYYQDDYWAKHLREFGSAVGRYLYLLDAVLDLEEDKKHNRYNPLMQSGMGSAEWQKNAVDLFIGDISEIYTFLPIISYSSVIESIIYSGMTKEFRKHFESRPVGEKDVP